MFVANHASYLDGLVLAAALPPDAAYVVKSELRRRPLVHLFLRRLGCVFVERFDPSKGEEESTKAARALARGDHLVIFPEGTLRPIAGLQRFRMGAFVIAARTATPVVPVVIGGTRAKLRGGTWLPRPGDVAVTLCSPEEPEGSADGSSWAAAVRAARPDPAGDARTPRRARSRLSGPERTRSRLTGRPTAGRRCPPASPG